MAIMKITKSAVDRLAYAGGSERLTYFDASLKGFGVRVSASGKSYIVETKMGRKTVRVTLGRHGVLTPEQARKLAKKHLAAMGGGVNPNQQKRRMQACSLSLRAVHQDYLASRALRKNTIREYQRCLEVYFKDWQLRPVAEISRDMVERRHRELSKRSPSKANMAMRYLRALFNYAMEIEDGSGKPVISDNPVRRLGAKKMWNRVRRRDNYIQPHQLKDWWDAVWQLDDAPGAIEREAMRDYLLLLLLTGLRREEGLSLKWKDIDFAGRRMVIRDTKNHEDHHLFLSDYVHELLCRRKAAASDSAFVFPSHTSRTGHIVEPYKAVRFVRDGSGVYFTLHDLRRTFASIVNELSSTMSYYTVKRLLNHKSADVTAGYVQLTDHQLRAAMQSVADYVLRAAKAKEPAEVIPLQATAR